MQYVMAVATTIAERMEEPKVVVDKSTVPVGTADRVKARIAEVLAARGSELAFDVVSNPEFLKEGAAVADCMRPDRIVIGTTDPGSEDLLREVYAPFNRNHDKIIVMDPRSAELTKYAANCMLATKISFMNEMANLAERLGADIEAVRLGIGSDPRIGYHFIYPGAGYGGSCFPKDVKALIHAAREVELRAAGARRGRGAQRRAEGSDLREDRSATSRARSAGRTFALWGLAFKPNTDDMREAAEPGADGGALGRGREGAGLRPRGDGGDPAALRRPRRPRASPAPRRRRSGRRRARHLTEWQAFRAPDFDVDRARSSPPR